MLLGRQPCRGGLLVAPAQELPKCSAELQQLAVLLIVEMRLGHHDGTRRGSLTFATLGRTPPPASTAPTSAAMSCPEDMIRVTRCRR